MGFPMERQSTQSFNPKHKLIIRSSNPNLFILSDEEAIKELELNEKVFFSFFLSVQPPSIPHQCLGGCWIITMVGKWELYT
jgi:hypothetical protein